MKLIYIHSGIALKQNHFGVTFLTLSNVMWILILSLLIEMQFLAFTNVKKGDTYFINLIFLLAKYHIHKFTFSKCFDNDDNC